MDLVTKLLAVIEETEWAARGATPGPWAATFEGAADAIDGEDEGRWELHSPNEYVRISADMIWPDDIHHIAHNDPHTVLRRCAADRKLVELHRGRHECPSGEGHPTSGYAWFGDDEAPWCTTLHLLADGYNIKVAEDD